MDAGDFGRALTTYHSESPQSRSDMRKVVPFGFARSNSRFCATHALFLIEVDVCSRDASDLSISSILVLRVTFCVSTDVRDLYSRCYWLILLGAMDQASLVWYTRGYKRYANGMVLYPCERKLVVP